jgi:hypothetical protein
VTTSHILEQRERLETLLQDLSVRQQQQKDLPSPGSSASSQGLLGGPTAAPIHFPVDGSERSGPSSFKEEQQ